MVQVVLPNDANPLGFILGGTVMHLIDIAGAIAVSPPHAQPARHRGGRRAAVPASDQGRRSHHPAGARDRGVHTSLEVEVEVFSEETLTGARKLTSRAYLTFVAIDRDGTALPSRRCNSRPNEAAPASPRAEAEASPSLNRSKARSRPKAELVRHEEPTTGVGILRRGSDCAHRVVQSVAAATTLGLVSSLERSLASALRLSGSHIFSA